MMKPLIADLRHAARALARTPGFTLTAVLMLALAMGALAALFSAVNAVLLRPLPFPEAERLFYVSGDAPGSQFSGELGVANEFLVHYRERSKLTEHAAQYNGFTNTVRVDERAERLEMSSPSSEFFNTLGVAPALGRLPVADEPVPVAVISDRFWADWFGRDPAVLGRTVTLFGEPREIVAVMPLHFRFPEEDTWLWMARPVDESSIGQIGRFNSAMIVRARPGVTAEALQAELSLLAAEMPQRFGGTAAYSRLMQQYRVIVQPLDEQLLGPIAGPLWLLLAAAAVLLVVACANLANLFLVRAESRQRELAVRRALGAGRVQLVRLQLAESILVAAMAGMLALLIAALLLPLLVSFAPAGVPRLSDAALDAATLAFTAATALLSGVLCGLLPAWRGAAPELSGLREGGRGHIAGENRTRQGLVVAQTAMALTLLIGAGLLLRSANALYKVDPGYEVRDVFTFQFAPEQARLDSPAAWSRFHLEVLERLRAVPGVQSVGLVENVPLNEGTATSRARTQDMGVSAAEGQVINITYSAGDYFRSMGISLISGREFTAQDHAGSGALIVSRAAAERLWPGRDPLGQRLQREGREDWETVVGVVENVLQDNFWSPPEPLVYLPLMAPSSGPSWTVTTPAYVIKSARADSIGGEVRALLRELAPEAPMYRVFTLQGLVDASLTRLSFTLLTLGLAATLAVCLGAVGLYGVLSYVVASRTREIGVRMALGAPAARVQRMIVSQGLGVVAAGVCLGLMAAAVASQALGSLLFGVQPLDLATFLGMALLMLAIGALASYLPARRASRLAPMESLRRE